MLLNTQGTQMQLWRCRSNCALLADDCLRLQESLPLESRCELLLRAVCVLSCTGSLGLLAGITIGRTARCIIIHAPSAVLVNTVGLASNALATRHPDHPH